KIPLFAYFTITLKILQIGFEEYSADFSRNMVDGDLLLRLTNKELQDDIGIKSSIQFRKFVRELDSLKIAADYSSVDFSHLHVCLLRLSPELSVHTYSLLTAGI
ncbi:hypothetical protein PFISCL1PPCAC_12988, partial [Pristionchus fissidentatus]